MDGNSKRSSISVRFSTLGLRVRTPGDLTEEEQDAALNALVERTQSQEIMCLKQIEAIYTAVHKFSVPLIKKCLNVDEEAEKKSEDLKEIIRAYFKSETSLDNINPNPEVLSFILILTLYLFLVLLLMLLISFHLLNFIFIYLLDI